MCPCQLLHIFPRIFNNFTNFVHLPDPPQTPQGPSRTPLGPPQDLLGLVKRCFSDWVGPRGWSTQLVQTHQTQTVIVATQRPGGMRGATGEGTMGRGQRSLHEFCMQCEAEFCRMLTCVWHALPRLEARGGGFSVSVGA